MKKNRCGKRWIAAIMAAILCMTMAGCGGGDKINAPFESGDYKGKSLDAIVAQLEEAGFTNIQEEPQETEMEFNADSIINIKIGSNTTWNTANAWKADVPIIIEYYEYTGIRHFEVTAEIEVGGEDGKPVFTIDTNLPDGTVLSAELSLDFAPDNMEEDYVVSQEITVQDGVAQTEPYTLGNGEALTNKNGKYRFGIVMFPWEQTEQVQEIVGHAGEAMLGDAVEQDDEYSYIAISTEYQSPIEAEVEKISEEELMERFEQALSGFGDNCEISVDGYVYTVSVWQDGLAMTATLAQAGNEAMAEEWDEIVYTTMQASASLQELLDASGYGDYMVQVQTLNDLNHDNILLTTMLGVATYNCVE